MYKNDTLFFCNWKYFWFRAKSISNAKYFIFLIPEKLKLSGISEHSDIKYVSSETVIPFALYLKLLGH